MPNDNDSLSDLREEIDEIDSAIHGLLMRRAAMAQQIASAKDDGARSDGVTAAVPYFRPARETAVLRRLVARHGGDFPLPALLRVWREIMSSLVRLQGPFSVAVFGPTDGHALDNGPRYWDMARDHYGSTTPMIPCQSAIQVLREVSEGRATVGVLPFPEDGEAAAWWPFVANARRSEPKVFARLPFLAAQEPGRGQVSAVAVACLTPEATGDDRSLLSLELVAEVSRARLIGALTAVGLAPLWQTARISPGGFGALYLIEAAGFVAPDDVRLVKLGESLGSALNRATVLGAYPTPMTLVGDLGAALARPFAAAGGPRS